MPLIIPREREGDWLDPKLSLGEAQKMISPYINESMEAYPVRRLRGKEAVGNLELAVERYEYQELSTSQGSLF